ncbi:lipid-A-disaccharide synthase [Candidatus Dependentiae bacterium]|nr:lipid-A-disaccharide synthase [Candidatus Dependentiae bacterium]
MKKIFIITGEQSGDMHGAALVESLKKFSKEEIEFHCIGGNFLKQQGAVIFKSIEQLSVIGIIEVIKKIFFFKKLLNETIRYILKLQPDVIIFIDYPGFNLKLAEKLKSYSDIKSKLVYYISPQIWAWHTSRVYKINSLMDKILVIFRFEKEFYEKYVVNNGKIVFVGHPLLKRINPEFYYENKNIRKKIIALLPGSRVNEIIKILPCMIEVSKKILSEFPEYKIIVSASDINKISLIKKYLKNAGSNFFVIAGNTYSIIQNSECVIVSSGTATLETGIIGAPMIPVYKVNYFTGLLGKMVIKIKNIALINIVLNKTVVKEFIQDNMKSDLLYPEVKKILTDKKYAESIHHELIKSREILKLDSKSFPAYKEIMEIL